MTTKECQRRAPERPREVSDCLDTEAIDAQRIRPSFEILRLSTRQNNLTIRMIASRGVETGTCDAAGPGNYPTGIQHRGTGDAIVERDLAVTVSVRQNLALYQRHSHF